MVLGGGVSGGDLAWGRGRGAGEGGEGGEGGEFSFSDDGFGGKYRPFSFPDKDGDGLCVGSCLGELPNF